MKLSFSQENAFYHFGLEEGLSQESVLSLLKDSNGFLWIGTQDGLNRFDGNSFTVYTNNPNDSASVIDNYINKLIEHQNKTIWIGTSTKGVCYYNPELNNFNSVGSKKANCNDLVLDKNGTVYASYLDFGLSVFTKKNKVINEDDVAFFKSKNFKITSLGITKNQTLYVGTKDGRMFFTNVLSKPLHFEEIVFDKKLNSINDLFIDDSKIWLCTSQGVYFYNLQNKTLIHCAIEKFDSTNGEKFAINQIAKNKETYYISTDNGLFKLDNFDDKNRNFTSCTIYKGDKNKPNTITSTRVYCTLIDSDKLFIGTNKLDVKSLRKKVFKTINTVSEKPLNNDHVYSIFKDENYTFIGTRAGLNCIDNKGNVFLISKENTNQKLANDVIRGITKDKNNNLWLTTTKGVSVLNLTNFNPKQPNIKSIYFDEKNPKSLSFDNTRSTFVDHNNSIWICTYGGGLSRFTGNLEKNEITFKRYNHKVNSNSLSSDYVFNITQNKNNTYWIATENGLNKLEFTNNDYNQPVFTNFYREESNKNSLNSNAILSTFIDKNQTLWVATQDGLHHYNSKNNSFTRFGKKEGLLNTFVYDILEDDESNLWLSTNQGLFKFNKKSQLFTNYNTKDGIQSSEFNLGPKFKDPKLNTLYFGGINGFNYFNPKEVNQLDMQGNLIFTSLKIKGEEISPTVFPKIIAQNITKTNLITLNHNQFPCYISFSELDFRETKNNQFVYKLLPNNDAWNELNDTKEIQLLDLPKGKYTLLVQGKTRNKLWTKPPLKIELHILPPWYKSNLAYIVYGLIALGLLFLFYKIQIQRKLQYQEANRLRELNAVRNKLYTNITHEFRTPITVILGMAQNVKEKLKKSDLETSQSLEMIERNSNNLLNLVNQMLDLAKLEKGKLELNLLQDDIVWHLRYLTESFISFGQEKEVSIVFYNEEEEIIMDYDVNKISQILTNLISNSIKFCENKDKIVVHVSKDAQKDLLILKVKDTGKGISKENLPFIFDRFYQVEHSQNEGTGIGLALTKELVELMNGTILVESNLHKGTVFTVKLPITNKAKIANTNFDGVSQKKNQKLILPKANLNPEASIALIVEDNLDVKTYINLCLENEYQLLNAENGEEGIKMAMEHTPDIIISDIMMPIKNGFELCETLKQDIKTNHIPIILLTAKASQEDKISGLSIGADAYLTKPFNKEELLIRVAQLIELRKTLQKKYNLDTNLSFTIHNSADNKNDEFINNVIETIQKHIEDPNFNAFYLARALNLSESQLYRKLKALTNTSTAIFIRKIRLLKAKQLLKTTTLSISEIAYATGFNDPSWFSKAFKEEFDISPSDIRN